MKKPQFHEVKINKLVHGGQGLGILESGKKAFVWGVLPGELVDFRVTKNRSDYVEGVASKIIQPSKDRLEPRDPEYLSTSPWQIMSYTKENDYKKQILNETFSRAKIEYNPDVDFVALDSEWMYRSKMEYSFFGDDDGLHLALFNRGTHAKQGVTGSSIARPEIDTVAGKICEVLNNKKIRASELKSVILRCNSAGQVVAALFTKNENFPEIPELESTCKGIVVVYSNPKSPASVRTKDLYIYGDISLSDKVLEKEINYDVFSFFQVNLPIFNQTMQEIFELAGDLPVIDLYSGVGTIGLALRNTDLLVESEPNNVMWAEKNAEGTKTKVVSAQSEKALDCIDSDHVLIVDPPRAGLNKSLVDKIIEVKPPKIIYLSCNPSTQARDLSYLQSEYKIDKIIGYNFFPRTPHIESLAILVRQ